MIEEQKQDIENFPAIYDFVLQDMANQCKNTKDVYNKLIDYEQNNRNILKKAILVASLELLEGISDYSEAIKSANSDLNKIIKSINELKEQLGNIPIIFNRLAPTISDESVSHFKQYIDTANDELKMFQQFNLFLFSDELNKYNHFVSVVDAYSEYLQIFQEDLKSGIKKGRKTTITGLSNYVYEIAKMYKYCTGNKFKVSEYSSDIKNYTHSMKFTKESLSMLYIFCLKFKHDFGYKISDDEILKVTYSSIKKEAFQPPITSSSFHNACFDASKKIKDEA